jgi:hypothetical protein
LEVVASNGLILLVYAAASAPLSWRLDLTGTRLAQSAVLTIPRHHRSDNCEKQPEFPDRFEGIQTRLNVERRPFTAGFCVFYGTYLRLDHPTQMEVPALLGVSHSPDSDGRRKIE